MDARASFEARDIARIAVFAAIIVVLGVMAPIPMFGGVPVTAQTLGVMLAGTVLGWRKAPLAVLVVLALVAVGLPVLAGGKGGLGVFVGPTAGYLLGWIVGAAVVGALAHAGSRMTWWRVALSCVVGGVLVIYAIGIPIQGLVMNLSIGEAALASLVFLPGDLVKVAVATILTLALRRAYPPAFGTVQKRVTTTSRA